MVQLVLVVLEVILLVYSSLLREKNLPYMLVDKMDITVVVLVVFKETLIHKTVLQQVLVLPVVERLTYAKEVVR